MEENLMTQQTLPLEELKVGAEQEREWEAVVEAVLFTMGNSVELRQLAAAIGEDEKTARAVVMRLKERYEEEPHGIQIIELEESFQMCTKAAYYENLIRVASAPKKQVLTDVVLETLSIIAYKQPVTKMEIEKIRGVKSDHAVNRLVEYNLVYEVGRLDAPGRPALFATTEEFLRRFGVGSTQNLPPIDPEQVEEIKLEVEKELNIQEEPQDNQEEDGLPAADSIRDALEEAAAAKDFAPASEEGAAAKASAPAPEEGVAAKASAPAPEEGAAKAVALTEDRAETNPYILGRN